MGTRRTPTKRRPTPRRGSAHAAEPPAARPGEARDRGLVITRRGLLAGVAGLAGAFAVAACVAQRPEGEPGDGRGVVLDQGLAQPSEVTLVMVGDVLMHTSVVESGEHADGTRSYDHLFAHVADDVAAAGVAIVSQETVLAGNALGVSSYPAFCSPEEVGNAEVAAGFDVALSASNHACDMGQAGIDAELAYWRSAHPEMVVTGVADSAEAAEPVPLVERDGHTIAILNYATMMNGIPLPNEWSVRMLSDEQVATDVEAARAAGAEAIVACPHWGTEYMEGPDDDQRHWAQVLADAGADLIIGGHPHVLQPVETVQAADGRTVPVFWSVGNFTSGQQRMDTMVGGMARATLSFEDGGCRVSAYGLTPLVTNRGAGEALSTYRLADYTEEQAAGNGIRDFDGCGSFSRQWCVDFCAERLGAGFDATSCEFVGEA